MFNLKDDLPIYTSNQVETWPVFKRYLQERLAWHQERVQYPRSLVLEGLLCREKIIDNVFIYYLQIKGHIFYEIGLDRSLNSFNTFCARDYIGDGYFRPFRDLKKHFPRNFFFRKRPPIFAIPVQVDISRASINNFLNEDIPSPTQRIQELIFNDHSLLIQMFVSLARDALMPQISEVLFKQKFDLKMDDILTKLWRDSVLKSLPRSTFGLNSCDEIERLLQSLYALMETGSFKQEKVAAIFTLFKAKLP